MKKCIEVLMLPEWRAENPYQDLLAENLKSFDINTRFSDYPRNMIFPILTAVKSNPGIDIVHLHWIAPYIERALWSTKPHIKFIKCCLIKLDFFLARRMGVKVVWTVHNLYSHESTNLNFERTLRKIISQSVDRIIFHSENNKLKFEEEIAKVSLKKARIVHHGNYIGQYNNCSNEESPPTQQGLPETNLLFLGQVRKYKGLDALISAVGQVKLKSVKVVVAGKVLDNELSARIKTIAEKDSRINYKPGFVSDNDLSTYFNWADVVVIPFEKTLTSGSAILGLSMGKVLILPDSAKVLGLSSKFHIFYYGKGELSNCIEELPSNTELHKMGISNLENAKIMNWESAAKLTADAYLII